MTETKHDCREMASMSEKPETPDFRQFLPELYGPARAAIFGFLPREVQDEYWSELRRVIEAGLQR